MAATKEQVLQSLAAVKSPDGKPLPSTGTLSDIVVTDGLKESELVIVEGIQKVRPGQVVTANVLPGT